MTTESSEPQRFAEYACPESGDDMSYAANARVSLEWQAACPTRPHRGRPMRWLTRPPARASDDPGSSPGGNLHGYEGQAWCKPDGAATPPVQRRHFHVVVWHRHYGWHRPRGRLTFGWHGHVLFHHEHGPEGAKERR